MCEHCEPPYKAVTRESDNGFGDTDSASYKVYPDMDGEPMLLVSAYDSLDWASASGFVPASFCPVCGRDLREAVGR